MPRLYLVDAFTPKPFAGNPAGVCPLDSPADVAWMQGLAAEVNASETAFFYPTGDSYHLRWFTPTQEAPICGHATLASAHVMWEAGLLPASDTTRFDTLSGRLTVAREGDWLTMDFPANPPATIDAPEALARAVGRPIVAVAENDLDYYVELKSEEAVASFVPDLAAIAAFPKRAVVITARASRPGVDFVSRVFGPAHGIPEDPVTGSTHCALTPYWAAKLGKTALTAYQASRRGGMLRVALSADRVLISGQAVTVFSGEVTGP